MSNVCERVGTYLIANVVFIENAIQIANTSNAFRRVRLPVPAYASITIDSCVAGLALTLASLRIAHTLIQRADRVATALAVASKSGQIEKARLTLVATNTCDSWLTSTLTSALITYRVK